MNKLKVWPHLTLVFLIFAGLGVTAAVLWSKKEQKTEGPAVLTAARVERVDGRVGLNRALDDKTDEQWVEVTPNTPLTAGDRLYASEDSRAGVAFTGRNFARLEPGSALDVVSLSDGRTQLALREGSALFNLGALAPGELFEVATPYGAVDFREPGFYEVGYNDDGSAFVSVLSGLAQVVGLAGSGQISKGEMLTLLGQTAAQVALSRLSPEYAGGLLDDYYGYQYPNLYDGRYRDYDAYLAEPFYYDPYRRYTSYRYVSPYVPGAYELDYYGDWRQLDGYGYAWTPRVESDWAPYQQGYWMMDDPHGLTWVSNEPWGYAPYHYGRWVNDGGRWYWIPEGADARPVYSPALVAFVPMTEANQIGWVPLAPGDPYAPVYYDANWQPHYLDGRQVVLERVNNFGVPGALTVVSLDDFNRRVERERLIRFDPRTLEGRRPVLDPLSHAVLRQTALENAIARRGFVLPPGLAKRLDETQVFTSARPFAPPFAERASRRGRLEVVPENRKREKLRLTDERHAAASQDERGDGDGRRLVLKEEKESRRREREERRQESRQEFGRERQQQQGPPARAEFERPSRAPEQRAEGERVGFARRAQREAEREQQRTLQRQQAESRRQAAQQQEAVRRAQQQQERMRSQQQERVRQQQVRQQQQEVRRAERQQQRQHASPGHMRQQQSPAGRGPERQKQQGPPQGGKQKEHGGGGGGKGKGRP